MIPVPTVSPSIASSLPSRIKPAVFSLIGISSIEFIPSRLHWTGPRIPFQPFAFILVVLIEIPSSASSNHTPLYLLTSIILYARRVSSIWLYAIGIVLLLIMDTFLPVTVVPTVLLLKTISDSIMLTVTLIVAIISPISIVPTTLLINFPIKASVSIALILTVSPAVNFLRAILLATLSPSSSSSSSPYIRLEVFTLSELMKAHLEQHYLSSRNICSE